MVSEGEEAAITGGSTRIIIARRVLLALTQEYVAPEVFN